MAVAEIKRPWLCCQIGARERYAVPRAIATCGSLDRLGIAEVDFWAPGWSKCVVKCGIISPRAQRIMEYVAPMSFSICYQNGCVACFSQSRYTAKRGWSWIVCEPLWWWQTLAGIPYFLTKRQPVSSWQSVSRFRGRVTNAGFDCRKTNRRLVSDLGA